ncbi:hypothetical protein KP79_PYT26188 [Mizuhopecten yessoensis]|uniref:Uncharacterized protein n=1 Tax=Mizuhopecten yessoensis TaxID=6573 RepID=A0A210QEZ7_MIZYE|nr:hypothetical protein KP79_PYT26188 [Mizuhopecten yessoensis]
MVQAIRRSLRGIARRMLIPIGDNAISREILSKLDSLFRDISTLHRDPMDLPPHLAVYSSHCYKQQLKMSLSISLQRMHFCDTSSGHPRILTY